MSLSHQSIVCTRAVSKTPEEIEATKKALEQKRKDKERRKREQEENVRRKQVWNNVDVQRLFCYFHQVTYFFFSCYYIDLWIFNCFMKAK
jgi:hypothetical protein